MKLASWNVNGIRACVRKGFFEWLERESPDLVCLQETKCAEGQLSEPDHARLAALGYQAYWHSAERKGFSGVATFARTKPLFVTYGVPFQNNEGRVLDTEHGGFTVPNGAYVPHIIVLLTDGVSNAGPLPPNAEQQAVDRGVRVYTIGFGTSENNSVPNCGQQFPGDSFGGGQRDPLFGGGGFRRGIDEETLKHVSDLTGGAYYSAESADELQKVFQNLPTHLITRHEVMEISVLFTAVGTVFAAIAIALSFIWHPLP